TWAISSSTGSASTACGWLSIHLRYSRFRSGNHSSMFTWKSQPVELSHDPMLVQRVAREAVSLQFSDTRILLPIELLELRFVRRFRTLRFDGGRPKSPCVICNTTQAAEVDLVFAKL